MLTTAWKNVKQQTIANCFAKAGFPHMSDTKTPDDASDNQDIEYMSINVFLVITQNLQYYHVLFLVTVAMLIGAQHHWTPF